MLFFTEGMYILNIKIFLCYHKDYNIIPPMCIPIRGGKALSDIPTEALGDDRGDNISHKNKEYCELTVQYYAHKNEAADFYGFCHYRRFFCLDESIKKPYIAVNKIADRDIERLLGNESDLIELCNSNDIIVTRSEQMGTSVRQHYNTSKYHYAEDLQLFVDILNKIAPHLTEHCDNYLSQDKHYFCNMYIMRDELFHEYCDTLFMLLEEFDKHKKLHGDFQSDRTNGYLAERFLGMFISYARAKGAQVKELPRIDVGCSLKKRILYHLLPPESKMRLFAKKMLKRNLR